MKLQFLSLFVFITFLLSCTSDGITDYDSDDKSFGKEFSIEKMEYGLEKGNELSHLFSVIVAKDGDILGEKYYHGSKINSYHNIRSVSKSFLAVLTGIAIENGYLQSVDQKVLDILTEFDNSNIDDKFHNLTIAHLLKMQSGLSSDDDIYMMIFNGSDWLDLIFRQNLGFSPGSKMLYSTAATHILGQVLAKVTGESLKSFADRTLLDKLGITVDYWETDDNGKYMGGSDMHFTANELFIFGQMVRNKGNHNGVQIVSESWIEKMLEITTQGSNNWSEMHNVGYARLWWTGEINGYQIKTAIGHGGQFVMLVPEVDMLIVTQSYSNVGFSDADWQEQQIIDLLAEYIIPEK